MLELFIKDLVVTGKHGVNESEKLMPQRFKISVHILLKDTEPNKSDDLNDTVDWSYLRKQIIKAVESTSFNLMERLAQEITSQIMTDTRIKKLELVIDKIDAFSDCTPGVKLVTQTN
jgi:7,8-dihydroneopterin aldolase/epimerase/oxygenase